MTNLININKNNIQRGEAYRITPLSNQYLNNSLKLRIKKLLIDQFRWTKDLSMKCSKCLVRNQK